MSYKTAKIVFKILKGVYMKFFSTTLKTAAVAALAVSMSISAASARVYHWKLAMTWPTNLPPFSDTVYKFADDVKKMSNGQLIIRVDSKNKHKSPFGIFDMVRAGQYEMGHTASYYYKGKDPNTMFFTTIPFGMIAAEQWAWFYYGNGMKYMEKVYNKYNIMAFPGGATGNQMGGWFRKPINSLADLKGLKMRIPGLAGEVMAKLGVTVTNIAPGELYTSLERGNIDALEWVGPGMDIRMGFHEIAKYYYTGWHEPATSLTYFVNKRKWDKLPDNLKAILKDAMKANAFDMYVQNYDMSARAWKKMKEEYPQIKVKTFPPEVLKAMKKATDEVLAKYASKDPLFKEILQDQRKYLKMVREWTKMSDFLYLKANMYNQE